MISLARPDDPNFAILSLAADALGELCDSLVFVGGCATGLFITAVRAQPIRATQDVDVIARVATAQQYHAMEAAVAARGSSGVHGDQAGSLPGPRQQRLPRQP